MGAFSEHAWQAVADVRARIDTHPFLTGLEERVGDLTGHPYGDWIGTYGDPAFAAATATAIATVDRLADESSATTRGRMLDAFVTASRHEWLFWDAAWRQEAWPV